MVEDTIDESNMSIDLSCAKLRNKYWMIDQMTNEEVKQRIYAQLEKPKGELFKVLMDDFKANGPLEPDVDLF